MAINYSLVQRPNPQNREEKKIYAIAQSETMSFDDFCQHVSDHGGCDKGEIALILWQTLKCLAELLKEGKRIQLDEFATVFVALKSEGVDDVEDFTVNAIKDVRVKFRIGQTLRSLRHDSTFKYAMTHVQQAETKRTAKLQLSDGTDGSDTGDAGNTGSGDGDGGNSGGSDGHDG